MNKDEELARKLAGDFYYEKSFPDNFKWAHEKILNVIRQVRNEALEEAAREANHWLQWSTTYVPKGHEIFGYRVDIAKAIRQLKRER